MNSEGDFLKDLQRLVKRYRAFFAVVGGLPPLFGNQLIPVPHGYEDLKYAASFVCVVVFGVVIAYRDLIAQTLDQGTVLKRPAPLLLAGLVATVAALLTTVYYGRQPATDALQLAFYVCLWPLYVMPVTVLLIFLYYQKNRRYRFLEALDEPGPYSSVIIRLLQRLARYEVHEKQNPALGEFDKGTLQQAQSLVQGLTHGRIKSDAVEERMPAAIEQIGERTRERTTETQAPKADPAFDRITINPNVMGGKPCIRGMRVTVGMIVGLLAAGRTHQEVLQAYPYLEAEDIREAVEFARRSSEEQQVPRPM